jgi:hypothetical protein
MANLYWIHWMYWLKGYAYIWFPYVTRAHECYTGYPRSRCTETVKRWLWLFSLVFRLLFATGRNTFISAVLDLYLVIKCSLSLEREYNIGKVTVSLSQWPPGLRREISSLTRKLGSWVWIPLKAWMSVCAYSVFMLSCVGSGLATGWSRIQGVLPIAYRLWNWKRGQGPTKGCRARDRPTDRPTDV